MTVHTITLGLPEAIHKQLESQAQAKARPIEEVAIQALARSLPPPVEDDLRATCAAR